MTSLRPRDIRAITFCAVTIFAVFLVTAMLLPSLLGALAITIAYALFILTRPRMIRVMRRIRGVDEGNWSGYYRN